MNHDRHSTVQLFARRSGNDRSSSPIGANVPPEIRRPVTRRPFHRHSAAAQCGRNGTQVAVLIVQVATGSRRWAAQGGPQSFNSGTTSYFGKQTVPCRC